jgi:hypothetical protein
MKTKRLFIVVLALLFTVCYSAESDGEKACTFEGHCAAKATEDAIESSVDQIDDLILMASPPKPDLARIKRDLIGRRITEQPNGYRRQGWYWIIEAGEIKEIQIMGEHRQGDAYLFEIRFILQTEGAANEVFANLTYVSGKNNEWVIDFLESKQVNIVRTGKYDKCITAQRKGWSGEYTLELTSRCDVILLVGGIILSEFGGKWQKFSVIVEPNGSKTVGGLFFVSVLDYKIHFIERPSTK